MELANQKPENLTVIELAIKNWLLTAGKASKDQVGSV